MRRIILIWLLSCGLAFANPPGTYQPLLIASSPVNILYQTTASDLSTNSTYTFISQPIGVATSDRVVIVSAWGRPSTGSPVINSVSIGGNVATQIIQAGTATETRNGIWALNVPAGTTANIVVNWSSNVVRTAIAIWYMTGTNGVTTASATSSVISGSPTVSTTINVPANGGLIATASETGALSLTSTWSGISKDFDTNPGTNAFSGGHQNYNTTQTGLTVSDTFSGVTTSPVLVTASWGP